MRTELRAAEVAVRPGEPTMLDVDVTNTADVIDGVTAVVEGIDPAWAQLPVPVLSLFPGSTATFPIRLEVPANGNAGDYLVTIRLISTVDGTRQSTNEMWIHVHPVEAATLALRPSVVHGGKEAAFVAVVTNTGNCPMDVAMAANDDTRLLESSVEPLAAVIPPGEVWTSTVRARGPRPWFGTTTTRSLVVTGTTASLQLEQRATFHQKPRIARGVVTALILAGIVALWATVFIVVVKRLGREEAPKKALATSLKSGGDKDIPLAAVAGTVAGTVTAGGAGLPRVTVTAYRVKDPTCTQLDCLQPSGSAATGDDGTYTLASLLPGTYKLRFAADGYQEQWYAGGTDVATASPRHVDPQATVSGVNLVLVGAAGAIRGSVELPQAADAAPAVTVTVTPVDAPSVAAPPPTAAVDGKFAIEGLPTPGTYQVTISSPSAATTTLEEKLAGGETKVLNAVQLGAAPGVVKGRVTSTTGDPLGGATVTITSGDVTKTVTTPTAGGVGEYAVDGLPTPRTYVVSFSLAGYSPKSAAIDLLAGGQSTVDAALVGGTGTLTGRAVDQAGQALGGVAVAVVGGDVNVASSTLTTAGGEGDIGTFVVRDLPTPRTYTITFTKDGYLSETRRVRFDGPGTQAGTDVTMTPALATVSGTVTGAGGITAANVELSDGTNVRKAATATSPPGAFSFADVAPGTYTLTASSAGHRSVVVIVTVAPGDALARPLDLPAA